jgi:prepilin-type N-terminal cleavage/methylation domain-containing protein
MNFTKRGFTLIELLIAICVIGILSAIAIPRFTSTKEKGYIAQMKSDLKNLVAAEETYASDNNGTYIPAGTAVVGTSWHGIGSTNGVTITIDAPIANTFSATATHASAPGVTCGVFYGTDTPPAGNPATVPGEPMCN